MKKFHFLKKFSYLNLVLMTVGSIGFSNSSILANASHKSSHFYYAYYLKHAKKHNRRHIRRHARRHIRKSSKRRNKRINYKRNKRNKRNRRNRQNKRIRRNRRRYRRSATRKLPKYKYVYRTVYRTPHMSHKKQIRHHEPVYVWYKNNSKRLYQSYYNTDDNYKKGFNDASNYTATNHSITSENSSDPNSMLWTKTVLNPQLVNNKLYKYGWVYGAASYSDGNVDPLDSVNSGSTKSYQEAVNAYNQAPAFIRMNTTTNTTPNIANNTNNQPNNTANNINFSNSNMNNNNNNQNGANNNSVTTTTNSPNLISMNAATWSVVPNSEL